NKRSGISQGYRSASTLSSEAQDLLDRKRNLEDLRRRLVLLPRTQIAHLERASPAPSYPEVEYLMSRRARHRAIALKCRLTDLLDESSRHRQSLPCVPRPGSRRQRNHQRIAAVECKFLPVVVQRNKDRASTRARRHKQCNQEQQQM